MITAEDRLSLLREIQGALAAQTLGRAVALAREALDRGVEEAFVLNLRAYWHEQEGRDAEALADLERARILAPDDVAVLNALGLAHARLGRMREAANAFDQALRRDPGFAPGHFNKGWSSEDLGELDTAKACYTRAAELMPQAADPEARLAALAARQGDWTATRTHAERALALQPRHPLASEALAGAEIASADYAAAEQRLTLLLAGASLAPADRARAESTLADLLDAQGRFGQAFAGYARRNGMLRNLHQARYAGPGVETMPQYLSWLTAEFAQLMPWSAAEPPQPGSDAPRGHVFVLGFARSGTTLLEEVLARDPGVVTTQERDGMVDSVREFLTKPDDFARLAALGRGALQNRRALYWRRIREMGLETAGRVVVDKQPFNTYKLPLIAKLFPGAKILFSVRDPRDVVLSCFRRQFRMNASTFEFLSLEGTARLYALTMHAGELFRRGLKLDLLQVRHEDLVEDFEAGMRAVCAFTGLDWSESLRDFAGAAGRRAVATPSSAQLKRGLDASGIGQWRNYRAELEPVLPLLAPWITRFGYSLE